MAASIAGLCFRAAEEGAAGRTLFGVPVGPAVGLITTSIFSALDTATDVAAIVSFGMSRDWGWFLAGLTVQICCGTVIGLLHAHASSVRRTVGDRRSIQAHSSTPSKHAIAHTSTYAQSLGERLQWVLGSAIGMLGVCVCVCVCVRVC